MHPSRQALLKGNSPSYDSPPHLSSQQNRNQGQQSYGNSNNFRQASASYGGGGGMMGSSTNTIPLSGRGRWGGGNGGGPSPSKSHVSFDNHNQSGRDQGQQQVDKRQGGWGERSGGQVGLRGSRTEASGGNGGDIWQTIPVEDDTKEDQGWGTTPAPTSDQENSWGASDNTFRNEVPSQCSRGDDGWGATTPTATTDAQYQTSGWDVPAPRAHPTPRSNTSSQRSQKYRQGQIQSSSPHSQQPRQYQQTPHRQEPMTDIQTPIRTESSGWYDYASPPPSFSKGNQDTHPRPVASNQTSGISGWGGERQNRAIQIKDPKEKSCTDWGTAPPAQPTSNASGGWNTPSQHQNQVTPASPISVIQQQGGWDAPKPEESIQRWTREVEQIKGGQDEEEVDGMDIEDTGGIGDEDEEKSVKADDGWGGSKVKVEQWRSGPKEDGSEEPKVDDGWGAPAPAGAGRVGEDAGNAPEMQHNSGWGQAGDTITESNDNNHNSGWGQPQSTINNASQSNDDGWGTPRNTRTAPTTDRETSQPGRSPMDQRQPITQAAKGMIQRHLQNSMSGPANMRSTSGEGAGRRSGGVSNLPERAAPQSNPFDVAAGDIWSSLPAVDDGEVIKPRSDSESDAASFKSASSKASSIKDEETRFRPEINSLTNMDEPKRIGRMSLASSDDAGSIHAHAADKETPANGTSAPPESLATTDKASNQPIGTAATNQPPPMLIDFDAPEEPYPSMTSAPSSTLTYSSTLIDMDDMLDLKTPITSPDRKVVGLDQYHPSKDYSGEFAIMAGGSGFQNALDLGQLAKMFENGYPVSGGPQK